MYLRTLQLTLLLATLCTSACLGQSGTGLPGSNAPDAGFGAAAGAGTPWDDAALAAASDYGPLGIGKPRTFPIWRHLTEQHAEHKAKLRASPLGKILQDARKMAGQMTGGVIPPQPKPNAVQLTAPGALGVSAQIQKDMMEAPLRLAAIQQLATVDCHWYPEALAQLTTALRTDRSECVRYEAAKILTGCGCCSPQMIYALRICVAGTELDGNPGERSFRVRQQAALALENCLECGENNPLTPTQQYRPEYPDVGSASSGSPLAQSQSSGVPPTAANARIASPVTTDPQESADIATVSYESDGENSLGGNSPQSSRTTEWLFLDQETKQAVEILRAFRKAQQNGVSENAANQNSTKREPKTIPATPTTSSLFDVWKQTK